LGEAFGGDGLETFIMADAPDDGPAQSRWLKRCAR